MAQYLFGFKTWSNNEPGEFLASGDGDDVVRSVQENLDKGFVRMGRLIEPEMIPVDMVPGVVRKVEKVIEPPKAVAQESKPLEKKRRQ